MNLNQAKKKWEDTWWLIPPKQNQFRDAGVYHITLVAKGVLGDAKGAWMIEYTVYPDRQHHPEHSYEYQDDTKNFFNDKPEPLTYEQALVQIM